MANSNLPILSGAKIFTATSLTSDGTTTVAVIAGSSVIYEIEITNTANAAATYLKLFNNTTATLGTTVPDVVVMCPASVTRTLVVPEGITMGTGVVAATATAGGTAGTTAPTAGTGVRIVYV